MLLISVVHAKKNRHIPRLVTINPPGLFDPVPFGFSHIRVDMSTGVAYIAGQVATNINGSVVGNDLEQQLKVTRKNINIALKAIKSSVREIISIKVYIKNFNPNKDLDTYRPVGKALGSPSTTLISTPSLAFEELLVEIEVKALASRKFIRRKYLNTHSHRHYKP